MVKKAVIFDFDGVIVESTEIKTKAFGSIFLNYPKTVLEKIVSYHKNNAGISRYDKFKYIYEEILKIGLTQSEFERLCLDFSRKVKDEVVAAPFVPGAFDFLERNKNNLIFYIVSATPQEELMEILVRKNIIKYFSKVYGAPTKKVDAVKCIISEGGFLSSQLLFVGDAIADYEAAVDNGVEFMARIRNNQSIFLGVVCNKINDLNELSFFFNKVRPNP